MGQIAVILVFIISRKLIKELFGYPAGNFQENHLGHPAGNFQENHRLGHPA
jgi:hypothetical protein